MYCPKCSQQQISEEMRFCSRCGFPLSGVMDLIASGGALVSTPNETPKVQLSRGQKNVRRGAWMMLASLALALVVGLLAAVDDDLAILIFLPLLCFIIGFLRVLYGSFVADKRRSALQSAASQSNLTPAQLDAARRLELSPPRVAPIDNFTPRRVETAEMVQPPSVTENTTRLLDDESQLDRG